MGVFDSDFGEPAYNPDQFSVMGFADIVPKLRFFKQAHTRLADLAGEADRILLMDSSSFNIPLAKAIKTAYPEKKIIYYILPQVWAWKSWRAKKIDRYCDTLAAILPFETDYYSKSVFVGHPLLDHILETRKNPPESGPVAFLPGSRKSEIVKLMPIYRNLQKRLACDALLVVPPSFTDARIPEMYGDTDGFTLARDTRKALSVAKFAFICSGTATLEAALIGTPFVLAYIAKPLDYFIARRFVRLTHIGLANIFLEKMGEPPLHEEFIQEKVTVENLEHAYHSHDPSAFLQNALKLRRYLHSGSAENVAALIES